jgi:ribose transport system substrate-binding protein
MSAKRSHSQATSRLPRPRRARWLPAFLAALFLLAVVAVGCGSSDETDTSGDTSAATTEGSGSEPASFTAGWMLQSLEDEFFVDQQREMEEIFPELGGEVVFLDSKYDPTRQLQLAQNWLNTGQVDAIAGSVVDINAFQPVLDQAAKEEVAVVLLGFEPEKLQVGQSVITQDFKKWGVLGGEAMGKCINERYDGKAEVALLTGPNLPGPVIKDREIGLKEGLEKTAPEAEIVAEAPGENNRLKGLQAMQTVLQAHPDVKGVMSIADEGQLGAMQAFKTAGEDPSELCIIGMDNGTEAHEAFENGEFYSQIDIGVRKLYEMTAEAAAALAENLEDPKYSEQVVVTDTFKPLY